MTAVNVKRTLHPSPAQIVNMRSAYGLTQQTAADLALSRKRTWAGWEAGESKMHPAIWRWFMHECSQRVPVKS